MGWPTPRGLACGLPTRHSAGASRPCVGAVRGDTTHTHTRAPLLAVPVYAGRGNTLAHTHPVSGSPSGWMGGQFECPPLVVMMFGAT